MILLPLLMQAQSLPDLELNAAVRARDVRIEQSGQTRLTVRAEPDAGSDVVVSKSPQAEGQRRLRNVEVDIRAQTRIADPQQKSAEAETPPPQ